MKAFHFLGILCLSIGSCSSTKDDTHKSTTSFTLIHPEGKTIAERFSPPKGYTRTTEVANGFADYLRNLKLKQHGALVHYYDGRQKQNNVYDAVIDIEIGHKDLQQCADAVMRLRAEYFYSKNQFDKIAFKLNNGFNVEYKKWMEGYRIKVVNNTTSWIKTASPLNTYSCYRQYMDFVFSYASTLSLDKNLKPVHIQDIQIGDVFVKGGSPGHAIIVVDMAINNKGEKVFMVAQSYMPAQDIQILKNENGNSPWYTIPTGDVLDTPEWTFSIQQLKRF